MKSYMSTFMILMLLILNSWAVELPALFSDNMVLQQNSNIAMWGKASANQKIDIFTGWDEMVSTYSNSQGEWNCKIQTPLAGGPFDITIIAGKESHIIKNVLIGEVWLCSGQSNMEMPLAGWPPNDSIRNSENEINRANYPEIRLFSVKKAYSANPKGDYQGNWAECNPQSASDFSATAYFFGGYLHQNLGVPVGLIHSSWGGTPIQAWMNRDHLNGFEEFHTVLAKIDSSLDKINALEEWLNKQPAITINRNFNWSELNLQDEQTRRIEFDDSEWLEMNLPGPWEESALGIFDGIVCFRKKIGIPAKWIGQELHVELGPLDDMDATYFNGIKIGGYENRGFWNTNRIYTIPGSLVVSDVSLITVRIIDTGGMGGFCGKPEQLRIYQSNNPDDVITLAGEWHYLPLAEYYNGHIYLFDKESTQYFERPRLQIAIGPWTPTYLYNAMIHPLKPFTIKGVIWYQGESNTTKPEQYDQLFPAMIKNWRQSWQNPDLPFYYAQIAPYDYGGERRSQRLREAQLKTLNLPHTGMAVTLDIGDPDNIHPANKQDVGKRLALWALANDYGFEIVYSGPIYESMSRRKNEIILSFKFAETGLVVKDDQPNGFTIAGKDRNFLPAQVRVKGNELIVWNPSIASPVAVRYAWSNTAAGSLFNRAGLPASSFRTDDW